MTETFVGPLRAEDRARWGELWRAYLEFYETRLPAEIYEHTWRRLMTPDGDTCGGAIHGLGARPGGPDAPLAGIVHFLYHAHSWAPQQVCYLQDLFVENDVRGRGCGRALIAAVAAAARKRDCFRLYWTTKEDNLPARGLYDRIARFNGFIRYDYPLG